MSYNYGDIGYRLQDVVQSHRYDIRNRGSKPDDPGWHPCSCGKWEGYWSSFEPHVADELRALLAASDTGQPAEGGGQTLTEGEREAVGTAAKRDSQVAAWANEPDPLFAVVARIKADAYAAGLAAGRATETGEGR